MATVSLRPITQINFHECISLKVAENQKKFVATNVQSLAEAFVNPTYHPFGIYGFGSTLPSESIYGRIHNV